MDRLKQLLASALNIDDENVDDSLSRDNSEEWDSFNHLMLMSEIEKQFGVSFTLQEIEEARSYSDIRALILKKKTSEKL